MARLYGIKKGLEQNNIDEKTVKEIIGNGNLIGVIERMESLLDPDVMYQILDSNACTGGKEYLKRCEKPARILRTKH